MASDQIEAHRLKLTQILANDQNKHNSLKDLSKKVGASITDRYKGHGEASIPQLVDNINQALQTATMIDMCKTANRNYKIALIATIIALGSAVALWIAVCK